MFDNMSQINVLIFKFSEILCFVVGWVVPDSLKDCGSFIFRVKRP